MLSGNFFADQEHSITFLQNIVVIPCTDQNKQSQGMFAMTKNVFIFYLFQALCALPDL